MRKTLLVVVCLAVNACGGGGGSGVSDSTVLADLTAEEAMALCEEVAGERTVTCDGQEITIGVDPADCATAETFPSTCEATAGDLRDCLDAMDALSDEEICTLEVPPTECSEVFSDACG
jgi:hypothetical protein